MEPQPAPAADLSRDYLAALYSIRKWKNFFLMLACLCLLVHAGAFMASKAYKFERRTTGADEAFSPPVSATQPAADGISRGEQIRNIATTALPLTEFIGRAAAMLLSLAFMMAVPVALVGRFPVSGFVRAFFWSIVVFAVFLPWDRLTPEGARVPGVFIDVAALETPPASAGIPAVEPIVAYARFLGYPLAAMILLMYANSRFHRSFREAEARPGANIAMRVV